MLESSKTMKVYNFLKDRCKNFSSLAQNGWKWMGVDGLLNLETAALTTIILKMILPLNWAMIFAAIIGIAKSTLDKSNGHENETHDLICIFIGIVLGAVIG
jgi:hypothetical protein